MIDLTRTPPKFPLGRVVATPGILELGLNLSRYIDRHVRGDWGNVDAEDWERNDRSISEGARIISAYETPAGRIWIITEADRSSTCLLLPNEY